MKRVASRSAVFPSMKCSVVVQHQMPHITSDTAVCVRVYRPYLKSTHIKMFGADNMTTFFFAKTK